MEKRDPYFLARLSTLFEIQQKGLIFTLQRKLKQKVEFLSDFQTLCKLVNSDTDYCNFLYQNVFGHIVTSITTSP